MKKQTYRFSNSVNNMKLRKAFIDDPELFGELIDAAICNDIASKLHDLRKSAGITQKELADLLGIKQSNISRWETPGYQGFKVKMLSKIVRVLGGRLSISIKPTATYSYSLSFDCPFTISEKDLQTGMNSRDKTWTPIRQEDYNYAIN